jgi:hypothetical protein
MDEASWLQCDQPHEMLEWLWAASRASDRKLKLFAVAC